MEFLKLASHNLSWSYLMLENGDILNCCESRPLVRPRNQDCCHISPLQ